MRKYSQKITTNIKNMTYINCPDNYPMEISGDMKKYPCRQSQEKIKQNMFDCLNTENCYGNFYSRDNNKKSHQSSQHKVKNDNHKSRQKQLDREILKNIAKKIQNNPRISSAKKGSSSYSQKVIPENDHRIKISCTESIRTYKQTREGSGIQYLQHAKQSQIYSHEQKRHLCEDFHMPSSRENQGIRCGNVFDTGKGAKTSMKELLQSIEPNLRESNHREKRNRYRSFSKNNRQSLDKIKFAESDLKYDFGQGESAANSRILSIKKNSASHCVQNDSRRQSKEHEEKVKSRISADYRNSYEYPKYWNQNQFRSSEELGLEPETVNFKNRPFLQSSSAIW